jgi:lactoylglutathione lyase
MPTQPGTIKGVSELAMWVGDLDRSIAFYRDTLGFAVDSSDPGHNAFLRSGDLVLALFNPEAPNTKLGNEYLARTGGPRGDVYHVGLLVDNEKIDGFAEGLRGEGLAVRGPVEFDSGRRSYFVEDPDEHYLEITDR